MKMDKAEINKFLSELQKDAQLRADFVKNPASAIKSKKYSLTPDQEEKLAKINPSELTKKMEAALLANDCTYHPCG
jgi:hypothetical protein